MAGVLLALAATPLACARPAQPAREAALERPAAPGRHAVHSARLLELMQGLEQLSLRRLPEAMDGEAERTRQREEISRVAGAMAASAARIPEALGPSALDAAERAAFGGLAAELEAQARALAGEARVLPEPALRGRLEAIDNTCARCHSRFRIPREPGG